MLCEEPENGPSHMKSLCSGVQHKVCVDTLSRFSKMARRTLQKMGAWDGKDQVKYCSVICLLTWTTSCRVLPYLCLVTRAFLPHLLLSSSSHSGAVLIRRRSRWIHPGPPPVINRSQQACHLTRMFNISAFIHITMKAFYLAFRAALQPLAEML